MQILTIFIHCMLQNFHIEKVKGINEFIWTHLSCIALDALSWSLRTSKCTWRAYLVKYNASSVAVSPPPTTARTCPLKSGDAPSQIAQALIPRLQNSSSRGKLSLLAVAPVATITLWHFTWRKMKTRKFHYYKNHVIIYQDWKWGLNCNRSSKELSGRDNLKANPYLHESWDTLFQHIQGISYSFFIQSISFNQVYIKRKLLAKANTNKTV